MDGAERDRELVTDLERESALLTEGQVMSLGGLSAADDARLRRHEHQVRFVSKSAFRADRKLALIDPCASGDS